MKMLMALSVDGEPSVQPRLPAQIGACITLRARTQLPCRIVEPAYDDAPEIMQYCDGVGVSSVRIGDTELLTWSGLVSVRQAMLVVVGRTVSPEQDVRLCLQNTMPASRGCPFLAWFVEPMS